MGAAQTSLMSALAGGERVADCRPWPRVVVEEWVWRGLTEDLATGSLSLLGLWGEVDSVHMAVREVEGGQIAVASLVCPNGRFPSVARAHVPALWLERSLADLTGLMPSGALDTRPWLDHGRWQGRHPLGGGAPGLVEAEGYRFLPAGGDGLHEISLGPVRAGIGEPAHLHLIVNGETVVRFEARLGYAHKGMERLMRAQALDLVARLAGRLSGDSTVAYALAFARAAESAAATVVTPRAQWLRALMAELERVANHLGDIGAVCDASASALLHAQCGMLREAVLQVCEACFGHRLMMDAIVPFGLARDVDPDGLREISELVPGLRARLTEVARAYDAAASLQSRTVGTGVVSTDLAQKFACGGIVGRASGRDFDSRRDAVYAPYDRLSVQVPVRAEGDVDARVRIRIREVEASLDLIERILTELPAGDFMTLPPPRPSGEGMALVEGFRGDVLVWVRVTAGRVERCHLRDPSWFQWPLLGVAVEGGSVADVPLCEKSFNCSYSGHDL